MTTPLGMEVIENLILKLTLIFTVLVKCTNEVAISIELFNNTSLQSILQIQHYLNYITKNSYLYYIDYHKRTFGLLNIK